VREGRIVRAGSLAALVAVAAAAATLSACAEEGAHAGGSARPHRSGAATPAATGVERRLARAVAVLDGGRSVPVRCVEPATEGWPAWRAGLTTADEVEITEPYCALLSELPRGPHAQLPPRDGWQRADADAVADAARLLAHEAFHAARGPSYTDESAAECFGRMHVAEALRLLGVRSGPARITARDYLADDVTAPRPVYRTGPSCPAWAANR
jgi:hypothetical protein